MNTLVPMTRPFPNPDDGLLLGGIFSGIGGWEAAAGDEWTQVFAAEIDPHARTCFELNTGRAPDVGDILSTPASSAPFGHVYTVSFPCQSSSQAGLRRGRRDPRGGKVLNKALKMIENAQPLIIVLENVKGFLTVQQGGYFNWLRGRLEAMGYGLEWKVLATHHFGLPQKRERLYMIAMRDDLSLTRSFRFPVGHESRTPSASKFLKRHLSKRWVNTIRCGGRGSRDRHAWDMIPRRSGGWYQLSVNDCKRLMGFPSTYKMPVPRSHQYRLLGNAISLQPAGDIMKECKRVVCEAYERSSHKRLKI